MVGAPSSSTLKRLLGVRTNEGACAALLFVDVMLVVAAYTTTKAVRDAIFLADFSIAALSWLMMATAVFAALGIAAWSRWAAGQPRHLLAWATNTTVAVTLSALTLGLRLGVAPHVLPWVLYLWSSLFGLFLVAEFWLLANDLLHARQARRLYGLIGAGAITGGIIGGLVTSQLSRRVGAANLLFLVAVELVVAAGVAHLAWRRRPAELAVDGQAPRPRLSLGAGVRALHRHPLVRHLAGLTLCATLCVTLAGWQWKGAVRAELYTADDLAAFFGFVGAGLSVLSLVVQLGLTRPLLERFGAFGGLAFLPSGVAVGGAAIVTATLVGHGTLIAAAMLATLGDGLRFSVDKSATELLYQPLPRAVREQAKPFIDTVVDRFAGGLAGLTWIAMVHVAGIDRPDRIGLASLPLVAVVAAWGLLLWRTRVTYLAALAGRRGGLRAVVAEAPQNPVSDALGAARASDDPRLRRAAADLDAMAGAQLDDREVAMALLDVEKRAFARRLLGDVAAGETARLTLLVRAVDEALGRALARLGHVLLAAYSEDVAAAVRRLADGRDKDRAAALELLDHLLEPQHRILVTRLETALLDDVRRPMGLSARRLAVESLLDDADPWLRAVAVHAALAEPALVPVVRRRTQDADQVVRQTAWRALSTARGDKC